MLNFIDRAIGVFNPKAAFERGQYRAAISAAYSGALSGKRQTGFGPRGLSANSSVGGALGTLRDRARHMVRNTGNGAAIVDTLVRNSVGTGITPIWNTGSDVLDRRVGVLWEEQAARSDIEQDLHFYGQQELAVRSMVEGGDMALRFVDITYKDDPRTPARLQLLEGDQIDASRNGIYDGRRTRLGVGLGAWGNRLGYWVYPEHPGELLMTLSSVSNFVDAADMRLLYRPLRIGQVRGVSWLAPVLLSSHDLSELFQNTIVKTRVEASFGGVVTSQMGQATPLPVTPTRDGGRQYLPEPGAILELGPGQEISFAEPKTSTQFASIAMSTLQTMAVGAGLTYDQVSGNFAGSNYTTMRVGRSDHRRFIEQVQYNCIIPRLCEPFAQRFIDRCIIAGTLKPRADGYGHSWQPPMHEPVDPKRELDADIAAVRAGRMTPQVFIGLWGYDWKQVVKDTATFWAAVDAAEKGEGKPGLTFDIDPRKPLSGQGGAQGNDGADNSTGKKSAPTSEE